jgi:hypothetical protein
LLRAPAGTEKNLVWDLINVVEVTRAPDKFEYLLKAYELIPRGDDGSLRVHWQQREAPRWLRKTFMVEAVTPAKPWVSLLHQQCSIQYYDRPERADKIVIVEHDQR